MNRVQTLAALATLSVFASFSSNAQAQLALTNGTSLTISGTQDYNAGATDIYLGSTPNTTNYYGSSMPLSLSYGSVNVDINFAGGSALMMAGPNGVVTPVNGATTLSFSAAQSYFAMRWGSIDAGNTISFYNNNQLVSSATGANMLASMTTNSSASYAEFSFSELAFDKVVMTNTQHHFDVTHMAFGDESVAVAPIPLNAASLGGLMSFLIMLAMRGKGGTQVMVRLALASIMPRRRMMA